MTGIFRSRTHNFRPSATLYVSDVQNMTYCCQSFAGRRETILPARLGESRSIFVATLEKFVSWLSLGDIGSKIRITKPLSQFLWPHLKLENLSYLKWSLKILTDCAWFPYACLIISLSYLALNGNNWLCMIYANKLFS